MPGKFLHCLEKLTLGSFWNNTLGSKVRVNLGEIVRVGWGQEEAETWSREKIEIISSSPHPTRTISRGKCVAKSRWWHFKRPRCFEKVWVLFPLETDFPMAPKKCFPLDSGGQWHQKSVFSQTFRSLMFPFPNIKILYLYKQINILVEIHRSYCELCHLGPK